MKLRMRGNSIRLRLGASEVATLARDGRVEETVAFGPGARLAYALTRAGDATAVRASLEDGCITVTLPDAVARAWCAGDEVGVSGEQSLGDGGALRILVEKDFHCLAPRDGEDDGDAYPHPTGTGHGCA